MPSPFDYKLAIGGDGIRRVLSVAASAALFSGCSIFAHGRNPDFPRVVHASADDCEIIAEVGKAELGWNAKPDNVRFVTDYVLHNGLAYVEDCPWHELGVAPNLRQSGSDASAYITPPKYSGDEARVELRYAVVAGREGRKAAAFLSRRDCTLRRSNRHWRLVGCAAASVA